MANTSLDVIELDFATLKASFRTFLQQHNQFQDFDFEGSNINMLLEVMSYNTYKNAFYLNMVMSEGFLDSAQLRSSVLSHAKELNYLPNSVRSAKANVTVTFEANSQSSPYTIAKGSPFSTLVKNTSYVFSVPETITVSSSNNTFEFTTDIYEGVYVKDTFVFRGGIENQRFKMSNRDIDTTSLSVTVFEDGNTSGQIYVYASTLLGLTSTSKVYFLQSVDNGYYELLFGDNLFGRQPVENAVIVCEYRTAVGEDANGASVFSLDFDPTDVGEMTSFEVTTNENGDGGAERQTVDNIKQLAPRYFATQQRAVASDDYASLVLAGFSQTISDVSVYGGEVLEPKQYGRVVVAIKPAGSSTASNLIKQQVKTYLQNYVSIPTRVIVADPELSYLTINTTVQYDIELTAKPASEIKSLVIAELDDFSADNLERFGRDFRYSRLVYAIDQVDNSIVSNDTTVLLTKRIVPLVNQQQTFNLKFNNELHPARTNDPVITSSYFTFQDESGNNYVNSRIKDDGTGNLVVFNYTNDIYTVLNSSLGTVNYTTGTVDINDLRVADYTNHINIYGEPLSADVLATQADILEIDPADCTVTVITKLS